MLDWSEDVLCVEKTPLKQITEWVLGCQSSKTKVKHIGRRNHRAVSAVIGTLLMSVISVMGGTVVFASSSGRQSALESKQFGEGHGAFTYAILEALNGLADTNIDGYISINELISYVSKFVPEITKPTGKLQTPTTPKMKFFKDFPLVKHLLTNQTKKL